mmetsp:Transcript_5528/g.12057  ORF Transcript_5528/g.12057 Transcript_5528/m.12057 type:complete len:248 (+) Transcript_5528:151-894(+)
MTPSPFSSTSAITASSSASVRVCPNLSIIFFSSDLEVVPSPSASNTTKACFSSFSESGIFLIMLRNSSKSISPSLFSSTLLIISFSSFCVTDDPSFFMTPCSSCRDIVPPPSLSNIENVSRKSATSSSVSFLSRLVPFLPPTKDFIMFVATTPLTAALNLRLALNFLNSSRFFPKSFLARAASLPVIQGFSNACVALTLLCGLTVSIETIKSLASFETVPQYSSWNSYSPLRIFRNSFFWSCSMKGG